MSRSFFSQLWGKCFDNEKTGGDEKQKRQKRVLSQLFEVTVSLRCIYLKILDL